MVHPVYYLNSKSEEYKNISVINRVKIIDDAFHDNTLAQYVYILGTYEIFIARDRLCSVISND